MKSFTLTATIWQEGRRFVSKCPELGVASFGKTPTAALEALQEAVGLYLSNARKLGFFADLKQTLTSPVRFTTPLEVHS